MNETTLNPRHIPWPKRPNGSNMTMGEMTLEQQKAQLKAAALRFGDQTGIKVTVSR